jgi:hypothetical protein
MTESLRQLVGLVAENPDLKGSFVEELLQTMLSGEFTDVDEEFDPSCEKVIGEMNDLDKALNTLCDRYDKNEHRIVSRVRNALKRDEEIKADEEKQIETELCQTRERFKIADIFRWSNIHDRFGQLSNPESIGFGVRSGHKIVLLYDNHDHGNPSGIIVALGKLKRNLGN